MEKNPKQKKTDEYVICRFQFWSGLWFLVSLVMLISVAIALYIKLKSEEGFNFIPYGISYSVVFGIFFISAMLVIINSIKGILLAKKKNDRKMFVRFLLAVILIIPFVSIYAIFASSISLIHYKKYENEAISTQLVV
ncbi:Hypothetical protein, predicted transmembrane protein [Metamycoplasma auris 15026]|uniref:Uncharacterized protein n=1 Tax=Metamycoplasma auris 15026 TaxID=1188233 RepID=N9VA37_9BACT|nr:hypothetical protein [Metamycoplasma auris]ENY68558.1 Hypothetical protein, predicted transmembrane protein [Metamycoplasma auris 15026]